MDVVLTQFPNKTIEVAPLGTSILISSLLEKEFYVKQYDINLELKNALLKDCNLDELHHNILPEILKHDFSGENYKHLVTLYQFLDKLKKNYSFADIEQVKKLLQERYYLDVFRDRDKTQIFQDMLNLLTLSNRLFEVIITNSFFEEMFNSFFMFKIMKKHVEHILSKHPKIIGISVVQMQRKISLWVAKILKERYDYKGLVVFGGSDVTYFKEKYLQFFILLMSLFIKRES